MTDCSHPSVLSRQLRDRIMRDGPIPFRDFMAAALYDPGHGYYAADKARIGRHGDFYTSVSVGPAFARLIGLQLRELWEQLGLPASFDLIEQGAHDAEFLRDLLGWASAHAQPFARALRITIIEPSESARALQRQRLGTLPETATGQPARWHDSPASIPPASVCGVHFSNELLDAFPVHRIVSRGDAWLELKVGWDGTGFIWVPDPIQEPALAEAAALIGPRPTGYRTEACLDRRPWIGALGRILRRGYVLAADYGYPADLYYAPQRADGTLACYRAHRRDDDPLETPGEKDITAHVDFGGLAREAEEFGFATAGFADQHHFLIGVARQEFARIESRPPDTATRTYLRQLNALTHPGTMGMAFKFLLLAKDAPTGPFSGFAS